MSWLTEARADLATDKILDAAAQLFAEHGLEGPGMDDLARAAGCSRATLYRHFANRRALQVAFARREAVAIVHSVARRTAAIDDPGARAVASVLAHLDEVRSRPHLARWYAEGSGTLPDLLRDGGLPEALTGTGTDPDQLRWLLRIVLSFLADPGQDEAEERRLIARFVPGALIA